MKYRNFFIYTFFNRFLIYMPYLALYLQTRKDMSNDQIIFAFSIYAFCVFLFEVPTGFLADRLGEKETIVVGNVFRTASVCLLLVAPSPLLVFVSQAILSLGDSLCSGTDQSLLFKVVKVGRDNTRYENIVAKYCSLQWIGISLAFLAGQALVYFNVSYVVIGTAVAFCLATFAAVFLPRTKTPGEHSKVFSANILRYSIRDIIENSTLRFSIFSYSSVMAVIVAVYMLFQPYLNELGIARTNNGILYFGITLAAAAGSRLQPSIKEKLKHRKNIFVPLLVLMLAFCIFAIGFLKGYVVLGFFVLFRILWGLITPLTSSEVNIAIKKDEARATILSLQSMLINLAQSVILFFTGLVNCPIGYKLILISLLLLPVIFINWIVNGKLDKSFKE